VFLATPSYSRFVYEPTATTPTASASRRVHPSQPPTPLGSHTFTFTSARAYHHLHSRELKTPLFLSEFAPAHDYTLTFENFKTEAYSNNHTDKMPPKRRAAAQKKSLADALESEPENQPSCMFLSEYPTRAYLCPPNFSNSKIPLLSQSLGPTNG
jgi:hypothetical protein